MNIIKELMEIFSDGGSEKTKPIFERVRVAEAQS